MILFNVAEPTNIIIRNCRFFEFKHPFPENKLFSYDAHHINQIMDIHKRHFNFDGTKPRHLQGSKVCLCDRNMCNDGVMGKINFTLYHRQNDTTVTHVQHLTTGISTETPTSTKMILANTTYTTSNEITEMSDVITDKNSAENITNTSLDYFIICFTCSFILF